MGGPEKPARRALIEALLAAGVPMATSLVTAIRIGARTLAVASLAYGLFAVAWWPNGLWSSSLPWGGALPALLACPLYFFSWRSAKAQRPQNAGMGLFAALFLLSIAATLPRGAFCSGWYLQPLLASLATALLGIAPGLTMTLASVAALLVAAILAPLDVAEGYAVDLWTHATSLAALTLASSLAGSIVNQLLLGVLNVAEQQRRKTFDSFRALRHRERLLRHAMRVETVGDLAGMVSHQLRNAHQVMQGHVALGTETGDESMRRLEMIGDLLEDSQPLLDQLMGLAHPEDGVPARVDLVAHVAGFHHRARRIVPAAVEVRCENADAPLLVRIEPRGLDHALWNLVINAKQAIAASGTITLRTGSRGATAFVSVSDDGSGIPPEIRDRIFDPYFTTKPPGQGTGLGLAAVARYVRGCGGQVEVQSEVGRGTTFTLEFPLVAADEFAA